MYIRTKNRIYKVESETCDKQGYYIGDYDVILKEQVINQSENLDELCDEFVVKFEIFNRSYNYIYEHSYDELKRDVQMFSPNYGVYGAVWTDKGLIYSAKMNDKGDLVLI